MKQFLRITLVCIAVLPGIGGVVHAADSAVLDRAFSDLAKFDWGQEAKGQSAIDAALRNAHGDAALRVDLEKRLNGTLKSEASRAAKDYACRCLARIGTGESVPALAPLLVNEDLSHMARYALERIPDEKAGAALLEALSKAAGKSRAGIAMSLGVRRTDGAVKALVSLLGDPDVLVASAAATALGNIGTGECADALWNWRSKVPVECKVVLQDALLRAAERLAENGHKEPALLLLVRLHDAPGISAHEQAAALAGIVALQPEGSQSLLTRALRSEEPVLRKVAGWLLSQPPVAAPNPSELDARAKTIWLGAIALKKDVAGRSGVLALLQSDDLHVRIAAIEALGAVGNAADVPALAQLAAKDSPESQAARKSLANLAAKDVDDAIVAHLSTAPTPVRIELLKSLAVRAARGAGNKVAGFMDDKDEKVQQAAIETIGAIGDERAVSVLVKKVNSGASVDQSIAALRAICSRERDKAAAPVLAGWRGASPAGRVQLIPILNAVGGKDALEAVRAATHDDDEQTKDAAVRALAEWSSADAAPLLLDLARNAKKPAHRTLGLRGFVRLTGEGAAPSDQKLKSLSEAMAMAQSSQDKKFVIGALGEIATMEALSQVGGHVSDAALADEAGAAAVKIVSKLKNPDKAAAGAVLKQVAKAAKAGQVVEAAKKEMLRLGVPQ